METKTESPIILTPDHRLRVFVSSTLRECADERAAVRESIQRLRLVPVMFESGARPHPAQDLYRAYLTQSHIFLGIYWQSYGWVGPGMTISGLEDEFLLSEGMPRLIYIKNPAPERQPELTALLERIKNTDALSFKHFSTPLELKELVENDLALLLTEQFETARGPAAPASALDPAPPGNIPTPRNQLIGRERELTTACDLLSQDSVGLVTLTGPGGAGKSRLGLQIALDLRPRFKDGVYLVTLAPINDPDLVLPTIADTLGLRDPNDGSPLHDLLKTYLRYREILLLLDNFEQVLAAGPQIAELLESCPQLKCVVTSRAPLKLRAEKELFVPPLTIPGPSQSEPAQDFQNYSAVELFLQRVRDSKPDLELTPAHLVDIAEICRKLDGLPLAIELAAARMKMMTTKELLRRLERRFDILRGGTRDLPERQQTMRGAIEWSYKLLDDSSQLLFRRIAIFSGNHITLEAIEAVCNDDDSLDVIGALDTLLNNSLITYNYDSDGMSRYGLLETIREYATERLDEGGEIEHLRRQHRLYYLEYCQNASVRLKTAERAAVTRCLKLEIDNLRAILEWSCTTGEEIETAMEIAYCLGWFWLLTSFLSEARQWVHRLRAHFSDATPNRLQAGLLWISGGFAFAQGDGAVAMRDLEESLRLARSAKDRGVMVNTLLIRGLVGASQRDLDGAASLYQECIEITQAENDLWGESLATAWLGDIWLYRNDLEQAGRLHQRSIDLARQLGDPWSMIAPLMTSAHIALVVKEYERARTIYKEAVDLLEQIGDVWSLSWANCGWGYCSLGIGDVATAQSKFRKALIISRDTGNHSSLLLAILGLAMLLSSRSASGSGQTNAIHPGELAVRLCRINETLNQHANLFYWYGMREIFHRSLQYICAQVGDETWQRVFAEQQVISVDEALQMVLPLFVD